MDILHLKEDPLTYGDSRKCVKCGYRGTFPSHPNHIWANSQRDIKLKLKERTVNALECTDPLAPLYMVHDE